MHGQELHELRAGPCTCTHERALTAGALTPVDPPPAFPLPGSLHDSHAVAASVTYGCSLHHIRLQPLPPTAAASVTYGCSLHHLRLQVFLDQMVHHPLLYFPVFYMIKDFVTSDVPSPTRHSLVKYGTV